MVIDGWILARALAAPETVLALDSDGWTALLAIAHAERLSATLALRVRGLAIPPRAAEVLGGAIKDAEVGRTRALWEVEMARRALSPIGVPVILLKGCAFVAAGLSAGRGRLIGDLDILVPRDRLADAEAALIAAGWEWLKEDAYDDAYYRRWMHELPPLIHRDRDAMIDVHHTILPLTARPRPDAAVMIAESVEISNGLRILHPEHMVIHAAAHALADGDLAGGMRNLWDIDRLVREFGEVQKDFTLNLMQEAHAHGLTRSVLRALRLCNQLFGTPVMEYSNNISDRIFLARITARDGWGRETRKLSRFAFYIRSHLLRMPPLMLARHLLTKWLKRRSG